MGVHFYHDHDGADKGGDNRIVLRMFIINVNTILKI
jgi:hypothetical protein